ncbi:hypothetical protein D6D29_04783 [Aureobasidium pullulans]|nr:hypothetical protein D6D29_04783 [Aureobasidium pullulans]
MAQDEDILNILRCQHCEQLNIKCDKLYNLMQPTASCTRCTTDGYACQDGDNITKISVFRKTAVDDLVPSNVRPDLIKIFDDTAIHNPLLLLVAVAFVSASPTYNDMNQVATIYKIILDRRPKWIIGKTNSEREARLVFNIIMGPLALHYAHHVGRASSTIHKQINSAAFMLSSCWAMTTSWDAYFESSTNGAPLYLTVMNSVDVSQVATLPPVKHFEILINSLTLGDGTKNELKSAVEDCYKIAINITADENNTSTNYSNIAIFRWLSISTYEPDPEATVQEQLIWSLILCHWAMLCQRRKKVWYFEDIAAPLFNEFLADLREAGILDDDTTWPIWREGLRYLANTAALSLEDMIFIPGSVDEDR